MSARLLALVAVVQGLVLVVGLFALLLTHAAGRHRDRRRERELARGRTILRDVASGVRPDEAMVGALDALLAGTLSALLAEVASGAARAGTHRRWV